VKVKNNGDNKADEVVQLYISVPDPEGIQPRWSLKKFARVTLNSGASTELSFKLDQHSLEQFNHLGETELVPGTYHIYVGNGSPGKRSEELGVSLLSTTFQVI
jgi:beta-glucosidase